jgi:ribosomal-protein-alanine N-acetyltransferase
MKPNSFVDIRLQGASPLAIDDVILVMDQSFDPIFGEAWTRGQCLGLMGLPGVQLKLAYVRDEPAGFALTRTLLDETELLLLAVRPSYRRLGIAKKLIEDIISISTESGVSRIFLEVRDGNDALLLYRKIGFVPVGRRRGYYKGGNGHLYDALTFVLKMSQISNFP